MGPVIISLFVTAAAFCALGLIHFMVWSRGHRFREQLLFALTCLTNGGLVLLMAGVYQTSAVEEMVAVLRWQISIAAFSFIALIWFVDSWTPGSVFQRRLTQSLSIGYLVLLAINIFDYHGVLYAEINGLRDVFLPWGEHIVLPQGVPSSWQLLVLTTQLGALALVINGTRLLWRQNGWRRACSLGVSLIVFIIIAAVYGLLLDLGIINLPWLDPYAFLIVVLIMNYEIAGEVVRASQLAETVKADEKRWRALLEGVRLLVIGFDRNGCVNYVNPFFQQVSGYNAAELMYQPMTKLLPNDELNSRVENFDKAVFGVLPQEHKENCSCQIPKKSIKKTKTICFLSEIFNYLILKK